MFKSGDPVETTETAYKYDRLNRLVKETAEKDGNRLTQEYSYDKNSNRTEKKVSVKGDITKLADTGPDDVQVTGGTTEYIYNALNQLITERGPGGTATYGYDANGNLTKKRGSKTASYTYDTENRLTKATVQQGNSVTIESYTYDYAGNRQSKTINESSTTYYVNDTSGSLTQVVAETDSEGNEKACFTRGDELLSMDREGKACYYHYDGHGNVRFLTDSDGNITDSYSYDAYGNLLQKKGTTENDFLYTGEQYNANTGLYYLRARYMDPSTGTFTSMDSWPGSLADSVSLHRYLYANANPVTYTDPSGYFSLPYAKAKYDGVVASIGMKLLAQARALKAVLPVCAISAAVILEAGMVMSSSSDGTLDITVEMLKQSLNMMVFAHVYMSVAFAKTVSKAMEASQSYVESLSTEVKKDKKYDGYSVYLLREHQDNHKVHYVGITNNPWRRQKEHKRDNGKATNGEPWDMWVVVSGLTKREARALEQSLICIYTIDALANARYEIAEKNYGKFADEIKRAADLAKIPLPDLGEAMKR